MSSAATTNTLMPSVAALDMALQKLGFKSTCYRAMYNHVWARLRDMLNDEHVVVNVVGQTVTVMRGVDCAHDLDLASRISAEINKLGFNTRA